MINYKLNIRGSPNEGECWLIVSQSETDCINTHSGAAVALHSIVLANKSGSIESKGEAKKHTNQLI